MSSASPANEEAILAWNTVLFDKFVRFRPQVTLGLGVHGRAALALHPPASGARVLDLGCGFGDTTLELARHVGPGGEAVGIDAAERFVEVGRSEAADQGLRHVRLFAGDVETADLSGPYDHVFSRFGTMFFASPVRALRNVHGAMRPGALLCMTVWRAKQHNEWACRVEGVVVELLGHPADSDEPTCGPGPFSLGSADVTSDILLAAGFTDLTFRRNDAPFCLGATLTDALDFALALGPAGEIVRLAGDEGVRREAEVRAAVSAVLSEYLGPQGVIMPSSVWIVTARAA